MNGFHGLCSLIVDVDHTLSIINRQNLGGIWSERLELCQHDLSTSDSATDMTQKSGPSGVVKSLEIRASVPEADPVCVLVHELLQPTPFSHLIREQSVNRCNPTGLNAMSVPITWNG